MARRPMMLGFMDASSVRPQDVMDFLANPVRAPQRAPAPSPVQIARTLTYLPKPQKRVAIERIKEMQEVLEEFATVLEPSVRLELKPSGSVEEAVGNGLGQILTAAEGQHRLSSYGRRVTIEEWAGRVAGPTELEREHNIPRSTLHEWQKHNAVIGLLAGTKKHVFPVDQFVDARPIGGIKEVVEIIKDPRTAWHWLISPFPGRDGKRPIDQLKSGRLDEVIADAEFDFRPS